MELKKICFEVGCRNYPILSCECQGLMGYFCNIHQFSHMAIQGNHNFTPLVEMLNEASLKGASQSILEIIDYLSSFENSISKSVRKISEELYFSSGLLLQSIRDEKLKCLHLLQNINSKKFIGKEEYQFIKKVDLKNTQKSLENTETLIKSIQDYFDIEIFPSRFSQINIKRGYSEDTLILEPDNFTLSEKIESDVVPLILEDTEPPLEDCEYLFFCSKSVKYGNFRVVDLNTFKSSSFQLNPPIKLNSFSQVCRLKQDLYFYYDGQLGAGTADVYSIDFQAHSCIQISRTSGRSRGACVCRKDEVYVFGGSHMKKILIFNSETLILQTCEKFELKSQSWKSIASLPVPSDCNSAGLVNDKIFVVGGFINSLLLYDAHHDRFKEVYSLSFKPQFKVLCEKWILVENHDTIFEITKENEVYQYNMNAKAFKGGLLMTCTFRKAGFIYFVLNGEKIIRLDVAQKRLEEVTYT